MTSLTYKHNLEWDLRSMIRAPVTWPKVLWLTGVVLLVTMVFHIGALLVTGGPVSGPVSLRKPATFAETGWLNAWSVALILPTLRTRAWQRHVIGVAVVAFGIGETTVMAIQAWRGVPSHYNFTTTFDAILMRAGAAGTAGVFLIGVVVLLVVALRDTESPASVRLGVRAGIIVLLLGCVIGFGMISNMSGVYQGGFGSGFTRPATGYLGPSASTVGPEYLLLRPETKGGDLILPHAIGVHGLVLLALPALLLARTSMAMARQRRIIMTIVASVGVAMGLLLLHALRQLPLDRLSPVSLVVLTGCGVGLLVSYVSVAAAMVRERRARSRLGSERA
jgi:hypothetical protein